MKPSALMKKADYSEKLREVNLRNLLMERDEIKMAVVDQNGLLKGWVLGKSRLKSYSKSEQACLRE